ncbi:MAG: hypothetical protein PHN84_00365 [Desulfuromonadaceae bacterium]|nr:hypothetical protein [Desulfuromonadaceae bacterium]
MRPDSDCEGLDVLINRKICATPFRSVIRRLQLRFDIFVTTSPAPFPASRLILTNEIRRQSEIYLPIAEITTAFCFLYRSALTYPPIISSTPFHNALSWADVFVSLPGRFQFTANPARLLETLLGDRDILKDFLFASFLPDRFYGASGRYPLQLQFIRGWLPKRRAEPISCLDAACGIGEDTYHLSQLLHESGYAVDDIQVEGWTIEPLEVWTAKHRFFLSGEGTGKILSTDTSGGFERELRTKINFTAVDLAVIDSDKRFDLIICNGLLGGPILHEPDAIRNVVNNLVNMLKSGGILLAADHFHGGWKQHCPQENLRAVFKSIGLHPLETGEGIGGLKTDQ